MGGDNKSKEIKEQKKLAPKSAKEIAKTTQASVKNIANEIAQPLTKKGPEDSKKEAIEARKGVSEEVNKEAIEGSTSVDMIMDETALEALEKAKVEIPAKYNEIIKEASRYKISFTVEEGKLRMMIANKAAPLTLEIKKNENLAEEIISSIQSVLAKKEGSNPIIDQYAKKLGIDMNEVDGPLVKGLLTLLAVFAKYMPLVDLFNLKSYTEDLDDKKYADEEIENEDLNQIKTTNHDNEVDPTAYPKNLNMTSASTIYATQRLWGARSSIKEEISDPKVLAAKLRHGYYDEKDTYIPLYNQKESSEEFMKSQRKPGTVVILIMPTGENFEMTTITAFINKDGNLEYYDKSKEKKVIVDLAKDNSILDKNFKTAFIPNDNYEKYAGKGGTVMEKRNIRPVSERGPGRKIEDVPMAGSPKEIIIKTLDQHLNNISGAEVYAYSEKIAAEFGIPITVLWSEIKAESGFNPMAKNKNSSATGLGQFLTSTWRTFVKHCQESGIHHPEWNRSAKKDIVYKNKKRKTMETLPISRYNPFASIYATAWYMADGKKQLNISDKISLKEQGTLYYLAHHEGPAGAKAYLRFLKAMRNAGYDSPAKISRLYKTNVSEFDRLTKGIFRGKQRYRISKHGIDKFLWLYYTYSRNVGIRAERYAAASSPEAPSKNIGSYNAEKTVVFGDSIMVSPSKKLPGTRENYSKVGDPVARIREKFDKYAKTAKRGDTVITNFGTVNSINNMLNKGGKFDPSKMTPENMERIYQRITADIDHIIETANQKGLKLIAVTQPPWGKFLWNKVGGNTEHARLVNELDQRLSDHVLKQGDTGKLEAIPMHIALADTTNKIAGAEFLTRPPEKIEGKDGLHLKGTGANEYAKKIIRNFNTDTGIA